MLLTDSMMSKLESLRDRFEEVAALLSDAEIMADRWGEADDATE